MSYSKPEPNLSSLPTEILLKVAELLDLSSLLNLSMINHRLREILFADSVWKKMYLQAVGCFPEKNFKEFNRRLPVPQRVGLDGTKWKTIFNVRWRDLALQYERENQMWRQHHHEIYKTPSSYTATDTVHFIGGGHLIASGSRDRRISLYSLEKACENPTIIEQAHDGWIWNIKSYEKRSFFSSSFDKCVKLWYIREADCVEVACHVAPWPAVSLACTQGLAVTGLNSGNFVLIEPRIPRMITHFLKAHTSSITGLVIKDHLVTSISEDCTLSCLDLRAQRFLVSRKKVVNRDDHLIFKCLAGHHNILYIGDSKGRIHLVDADDDFSVFMSIPVTGGDNQESIIGSSKMINSLLASLGSVIAADSEKRISVLVPSSPPTILTEMKLDSTPTCVDYRRGTLAVALGSGALNIINAQML